MEEINKYLDNIFKGIDDTIKLDKEQKEAILCDAKQQLIIAGAGSGKTTVLAGKVKYLVDILKVDPESILVISFTNKAVLELKERINEKMGILCDIKTFHKFGLEIIKEKKPDVIVCSDTTSIIKSLIYKKGNVSFKKLYCMYYRIKKITKIINIMNPVWRIEKDKEEEFISFIITIIQKIKNKEINEFNDVELKEIILDIVSKYNDELAKNNIIDFIDMITNAINIINESNIFPYQYIIIDEYQDISMSRHILIKSIIDKFNPYLICVGDDWQSIYAFSGSKIDLFTDFKKIYPQTEIMKITNTYRNSQELINIAGTFIMQNDQQITKSLHSSKHITNPIKIIKYSQNNKSNTLSKIINSIIEEYPQKNILILGRYNFDINKFVDNKNIKYKNGIVTYKNKHKISFMTVHASKGLGFDNVILINCSKGIHGFPTEKEDNNVLKKLQGSNKEEQLNEERRLFYVALTRTKNNIYLLVPRNNQSEFIIELEKYLGYVSTTK